MDLKAEGYIIGIEKYKREDIGAPEGQKDQKDQKDQPVDWEKFVKLPTPKNGNKVERKLIKKQNKEFIDRMNDRKPVLVTHIVSYFPKREYIYNAYAKSYYKGESKPKGEKGYEEGYKAIEKLRNDLQEKLERADKPYSHILIMSMGWNNDQYDSISSFNRIIENLKEQAKCDGDTKFKPLVIGITWPSVWGGIEDFRPKKALTHILSYWNKRNDADEIGYSIANWLINRELPKIRNTMGPEKFPKVVALGHSFGARLLSRAIFSREHLKDLPDTTGGAVDLYFGLQGAFSARRFVASCKWGGEGAPYFKYDAHLTKIVLTSSENDKDNSVASKYVGGEGGLRYMEKENDIFAVFKWSEKPEKQEEVRQAIQNYATNRRIIVLDMTGIVTSHGDIYDAEVARLIWFFLKQM